MFNTTTKNEYNITYKKIKYIKHTGGKKTSYLKKIETYFNKVASAYLKLYTNQNTIKEIIIELSNRYTNNSIITFNNNKYSIDVYSYNNHYYVIDCFHMNTITLQNYKKLIYEIHALIVNDQIKRKQYTTENANNNTDDRLCIIVDNINKLEENKVKVIQHVFNNKIFSTKTMFNYIEMHYYLKNNDNAYLKTQGEMFIEFNTPLNKKEEDDAFILHLMEIAPNELYKLIQNEFCNEKYSLELILKIYKYVIHAITQSACTTVDDKIQLMHDTTAIFGEFNRYYNVDTMKHLIYENFIVDAIRVFNKISN